MVCQCSAFGLDHFPGTISPVGIQFEQFAHRAPEFIWVGKFPGQSGDLRFKRVNETAGKMMIPE
jgi:hypothetical protein